MRKSISINLPGELKEELDRLTGAEGVTRSDIVREALRAYRFTRHFNNLRGEMIPYAEAQRIFIDEDVFRGVP